MTASALIPARRLSRSTALVVVLALVSALLPLLSRAGQALSPPAPVEGYWLVGQDGGVFSFGDAKFFGSTGDIRLNQPVTGMAASRSGAGYWFVASDGGIFAFGDAKFFGSTGDLKLNRPIVGMAATPSGQGYWLVASDGGIFAFGDARFFGSTGDLRLNKPIVGMASTPTGAGYWMVASDGGIFAFGDARFFGSTGALKLNQPIVSMATTPTGAGYWMSASDGGIFSFGDANFFGSAAAEGARSAVVSMVPTASGRGYWQITADGPVHAFGDAGRYAGVSGLARKVVGSAALPKAGGPVGPGPATPTTVTTFPSQVAEKGPANVVVIVMDDMRSVGFMDDPLVMPKTKEWLQAAGATFPQGVATTPLCCPERATIWSGRLPHNHRIFDNDDGDSLDREWIIPRYLQDAGYKTGLVGKFITNWIFATEAEGRYELEHWDEYSAFQGGYLNKRFRVKDGPGKLDYHTETGAYSTDYIGQRAIEYIDKWDAEADDQPFYLHITPHAPHDEDRDWAPDPAVQDYDWPARHNDTPVPPFTPSPARTDEATEAQKADKIRGLRDEVLSDEAAAHTWQGQMKTLLAADEMIDSVMKELQAKGELDNTMVIFTSDNGYAHGERGLTSKGYPYVEHISVPFLVRWDGVFAPGSTDPRPVGGEDILPTVLAAAKYTPPTLGHPLDGKPFLPGAPGKPYKVLEFGPNGPVPGASEGIGPGFYKPHRGIPTWAALRTADWHYIEYYESSDHTTLQWAEYYDLRADPWELDNLLADGDPANDPPDLAELQNQLRQARSCVGAGCP